MKWFAAAARKSNSILWNKWEITTEIAYYTRATVLMFDGILVISASNLCPLACGVGELFLSSSPEWWATLNKWPGLLDERADGAADFGQIFMVPLSYFCTISGHICDTRSSVLLQQKLCIPELFSSWLGFANLFASDSLNFGKWTNLMQFCVFIHNCEIKHIFAYSAAFWRPI